MKAYLKYLFIVVVFAQCAGPDSSQNSGVVSKESLNWEKTELKYAKGFTIQVSGNLKYIEVRNPWKEEDILASYLLAPENIDIDTFLGVDFIVSIPVHSVASLSSTFLGMFCELNARENVLGNTEPQLIYDSILQKRFQDKKLLNLGEAMKPNLEAIISAAPELLMKYIYGSKEDLDIKVMESGIPIAYNQEFMEDHPLGRAEWIKFVAAFLDKDEIADSVFTYVEKQYLQFRNKAKHQGSKPTVLDGSSYKGVWYAAGGMSYPAKLYSDAGAEYFWKNDSTRGSLPLSFEVIIENQANADFWIGPSSGSKAELLNIENRYALLKSFKNDNVFNFGRRVNSFGGQDYYESGTVRPDRLLGDLLWVFHPQLLEEGFKPYYIQRIK